MIYSQNSYSKLLEKTLEQGFKKVSRFLYSLRLPKSFIAQVF